MAQTIHTVVFEAQAGGGNPCPVTLSADDLTTEEMQKMTKDFGEESAYLMKSDNPECDFRARYFVPLHEMEMCIHATIGSATVLVEKGIVETSPIYYETGFGPVRIDWERKDGRIDVGVNQFLPQKKENNPTAEEICEVLRIEAKDLASFSIESVATSRFKLMVPLASREIVDNLDPDFEALWNLCDKYDTTGFYVFAKDEEDGEPIFWARQFPKRAGYNEDPATGVAASALGAYLADNKIIETCDGWNSFKIYQGFAMGRPSVIYSDIKMENGAIVGTKVRGNAYLV